MSGSNEWKQSLCFEQSIMRALERYEEVEEVQQVDTASYQLESFKVAARQARAGHAHHPRLLAALGLPRRAPGTKNDTLAQLVVDPCEPVSKAGSGCARPPPALDRKRTRTPFLVCLRWWRWVSKLESICEPPPEHLGLANVSAWSWQSLGHFFYFGSPPKGSASTGRRAASAAREV